MKTLARWMGVVVLLATAGTGAALAQHQIFHINPARSEAHFTFEGSNPAITGTFQVAKRDRVQGARSRHGWIGDPEGGDREVGQGQPR
jgi:hypothetical protein